MGLVGLISGIVFEGNFFLTDEHLIVIAAGRKGEERTLAATAWPLLQEYLCTIPQDGKDTITQHFLIQQDWGKVTACTDQGAQ